RLPVALLGSATGKRVAQPVGPDEVSVGRRELRSADPPVVPGYDPALHSAITAFSATIKVAGLCATRAYGRTFRGAAPRALSRIAHVPGRDFLRFFVDDARLCSCTYPLSAACCAPLVGRMTGRGRAPTPSVLPRPSAGAATCAVP
ncbi:hypothetical protein CF645_38240, partial [Burkholderia pseudomallei]|uniref:hypothetical protein n=1 Tax=Burkholderia pseudomallei TaxID=28450 RepID=UPI000CCE1811